MAFSLIYTLSFHDCPFVQEANNTSVEPTGLKPIEIAYEFFIMYGTMQCCSASSEIGAFLEKTSCPFGRFFA